MQARGETLGVLSFYTMTEHDFTTEEVQILCTLGGQAAMAIQNARLYEEAKRSSQELSALLNVTAAASQSLNLDTVLREVIQKISEIFHFVTTRIFLFDASREELHLRASLEPCPEWAPRLSAVRRGQGIVGKVAEIGRPVVFDDPASDPTYLAWSLNQTAIKFGFHFIAGFPIKTKDQVLGVLVCTGTESRTLPLQETRLLTSMANQIAVAVENMQLFAQTKTQASQLSESREQLRRFAGHLQSAREQERTQVAREIHDELGQLLTGLKMDLAWLRKKLPQKKSLLIDKANSMSQLLDQSIQTVRKISPQLRPSVLDSLGLTAAIEWQLHEFRTRNEKQCNVRSHLEEVQLDPQRSTALFRIFQEGLTNITRHARANHVEISLRKEGRYVVLEVADNGIGIDPGMILDPKSLGLLGMRERALLLGGQVVVGRTLQGGTSVTARLPIEARA